MKAAYWESLGVMNVKEIPEPKVGPAEVKIKIEYCGICENDIFIMEGNFPPIQPPLILGHEFSGTIVEVGNEVKDLKVGQRVACNMQVFCGHCYYCHEGYENFCENVQLATGAFAEYSVVSQNACEILPDDMSFKTGSFLELTSAAMYSLQRADVEAGRTLVTFGGGAKAQLEIMLARMKGASTIVNIEPDPDRRAQSLKSGADFVIDPTTQDVVKECLAMTNGRGFDNVIESSGDPKNCRLSIDIARKGATINWAANYYMSDEVTLPLFTVRTDKCLTIRTSLQSPYLFHRGLNMLPRIDVESLISAIYPLDQIQEAFNMQAKNKAQKILIKP